MDPVPPVAAEIFEKSSSSNSRRKTLIWISLLFQKKITLSPIIMVQWKLAVFERSHFSLNHGAMGGRKSMIQNLLSLHRTCPDIPKTNIALARGILRTALFFPLLRLVVWDRETPRRVSRKPAQISCSRRAKLCVAESILEKNTAIPVQNSHRKSSIKLVLV